MPTQDQMVKVCKTFFLHTLGVSERYVTTTDKLTGLGICRYDGRGKHSNRSNKVTTNHEAFVQMHIQSFPTVESHYCRKDTKKEYHSPDLSVAKMYSLYHEQCAVKEQTPSFTSNILNNL